MVFGRFLSGFSQFFIKIVTTMGIFKDFFSLKWLNGATAASTSTPATTTGGGSSVAATNAASTSSVTPTTPIFDSDVSPNKAFPSLMWAFFYGVFLIMIFTAIVGWRADLFIKGVSVVAIIFALILAFIFGLVAILSNYVWVISGWQAVKIVSDIVKNPKDYTDASIRALLIGYTFAGVCGIGGALGLYLTANFLLDTNSRINLMFNQTSALEPQQMAAGYVPRAANALVPDRHVVKAGETVKIIADKYKLDVAAIVALNNLPDANKIEKGQILKLQ